MLKQKDQYFIIDGVLCIKERGGYQEVKKITFYPKEGGRAIIVLPLFTQQHLVLLERKGREKVSIFALKRIPKSGKFAELPAREGYIAGDWKTTPYVLKQRPAPPTRRRRRYETAGRTFRTRRR